MVEPLSLDEFAGQERFSAGELQAKNPQHAGAARHVDAVIRGGQHRAGFDFRRGAGAQIRVAQFGIPDAELRAIEARLGNRPGIEGADAAPNLQRILTPIDERFVGSPGTELEFAL